jgi:hypothetical protein
MQRKWGTPIAEGEVLFSSRYNKSFLLAVEQEAFMIQIQLRDVGTHTKERGPA